MPVDFLADVGTGFTGNDSEAQTQPAHSGLADLAPQAWISRFAEPLIKSANGPLAGLSFAVKDNIHGRLVAAAGNAEMARVHRDVTERIRIIRRLDFTKPARIDATYDEHAKILKAVRATRADPASMLLRAHIQSSQAEVRKITLHQVHLARQGVVREV